jgi:hypothetical protein
MIYANKDVPKNTDTVTIWHKEESNTHKNVYLPMVDLGFYENGEWNIYDNAIVGVYKWRSIINKNVFAWASTIFADKLEKEFDKFCS